MLVAEELRGIVFQMPNAFRSIMKIDRSHGIRIQNAFVPS